MEEHPTRFDRWRRICIRLFWPAAGLDLIAMAVSGWYANYELVLPGGLTRYPGPEPRPVAVFMPIALVVTACVFAAFFVVDGLRNRDLIRQAEARGAGRSSP